MPERVLLATDGSKDAALAARSSSTRPCAARRKHRG
jgi:hypothetical protein